MNIIKCHDNLVHIFFLFWDDYIIFILVDSYIDGDWEILKLCDILGEHDWGGAPSLEQLTVFVPDYEVDSSNNE